MKSRFNNLDLLCKILVPVCFLGLILSFAGMVAAHNNQSRENLKGHKYWVEKLVAGEEVDIPEGINYMKTISEMEALGLITKEQAEIALRATFTAKVESAPPEDPKGW